MSDEELVKRLRKLADDMEKHAASDWDEHEDVASAADRIEQLERLTRGQGEQLEIQGNKLARLSSHGHEQAARIQALTEQLEAARADAKEAEAYAEELEKELNICRMAQVVMENGIAEAEKERDTAREYAGEVRKREMAAEDARVTATDKLAKAVEALGNVVGEYDLFRKDEYERGMSPLDDEIHDARTTLAELKGEKDE